MLSSRLFFHLFESVKRVLVGPKWDASNGPARPEPRRDPEPNTTYDTARGWKYLSGSERVSSGVPMAKQYHDADMGEKEVIASALYDPVAGDMGAPDELDLDDFHASRAMGAAGKRSAGSRWSAMREPRAMHKAEEVDEREALSPGQFAADAKGVVSMSLQLSRAEAVMGGAKGDASGDWTSDHEGQVLDLDVKPLNKTFESKGGASKYITAITASRRPKQEIADGDVLELNPEKPPLRSATSGVSMSLLGGRTVEAVLSIDNEREELMLSPRKPGKTVRVGVAMGKSLGREANDDYDALFPDHAQEKLLLSPKYPTIADGESMSALPMGLHHGRPHALEEAFRANSDRDVEELILSPKRPRMSSYEGNGGRAAPKGKGSTPWGKASDNYESVGVEGLLEQDREEVKIESSEAKVAPKGVLSMGRPRLAVMVASVENDNQTGKGKMAGQSNVLSNGDLEMDRQDVDGTVTQKTTKTVRFAALDEPGGKSGMTPGGSSSTYVTSAAKTDSKTKEISRNIPGSKSNIRGGRNSVGRPMGKSRDIYQSNSKRNMIRSKSPVDERAPYPEPEKVEVRIGNGAPAQYGSGIKREMVKKRAGDSKGSVAPRMSSSEELLTPPLVSAPSPNSIAPEGEKTVERKILELNDLDDDLFDEEFMNKLRIRKATGGGQK